MMSQKSHSLKLFLWKNIFVVGAGVLASFLGLNFNPNDAAALYTPTLSASVDQTNLQVDGNQVIDSADQTTEIPLNLIVNTNNKTGYTATLNPETNETALVNAESVTGAKIESIDANKTLAGFSDNTWGVKVGSNTNFSPIPKPTSPMSIIQTASKTNGDEVNSLEIGLKLGDNLESGNYNNKLIFSILTNNYEHIAIMTEGPDFNTKLKALETATNKIEHFKKSPVAPATSMNTVNIEDEDSDYEIKLWLDPADKTAYYYAEPEKVYLNKDSSRMFLRMSNLTSLNISNLDTSKVTNMRSMFDDVSRLISLGLFNFDTSQVTDMNSMFYGMSSLTSLNLSNFNTSNVTDMREMFFGTRSLASLNLSNFDTSNVTDMSFMFFNSSKLTSLNLSNFNTSKVIDMSYMFSVMSSLTSLNLSNFDTSKVINMECMFYGVSSLTSLNLSNFDTSQVMNMSTMFREMFSLTSLNLSNFDTSKVTNMRSMFYDMFKLTSLNLSNFNTSNVTDMSYMFALSYEDRDKLEIYVNNDFDTSQLTSFSNMFLKRKKLRGGNGSYLADPSTADKSWLRIDDPTHGRPGYFTRKP